MLSHFILIQKTRRYSFHLLVLAVSQRFRGGENDEGNSMLRCWGGPESISLMTTHAIRKGQQSPVHIEHQAGIESSEVKCEVTTSPST